jgi:hypothetical protein
MREAPKKMEHDTLSLKVGSWFEAHATGRGVIAIVAVVLLLALVTIMQMTSFTRP